MKRIALGLMCLLWLAPLIERSLGGTFLSLVMIPAALMISMDLVEQSGDAEALAGRISRAISNHAAYAPVLPAQLQATPSVDPDTGLSLGAVESKVGTIKVTNNSIGNGKASECTALSGTGFERNDIVRPAK